MTGACVSFGPKLSHKSGIPVAQVRNCNKNCNKQKHNNQGLTTKTLEKAVGNTVNKTRRGAGADARARPEGRETPSSLGRGPSGGDRRTRSIASYRGLLTRKSGNYLITL